MGNQASKTAAAEATTTTTTEDNKVDPQQQKQQKNHDTTAGEDHDFEIIDKDEIPQNSKKNMTATDNDEQQQQQCQQEKNHPGLWMGIDLGTSNCAAAIWDSTRGRPKWMRLQNIAVPQQSKGGKAGRIVPSAVQLMQCTGAAAYLTPSSGTTGGTGTTANTEGVFALQDSDSLLWKDIQSWNPQLTASAVATSTRSSTLQTRVGHQALLQLQETLVNTLDNNNNNNQESANVITSMKRVLGVCDTTPLRDLDHVFRQSLPFVLEERSSDGKWVVPCPIPDNSKSSSSTSNTATVLYLRPIHVAAILLQAIRQKSQDYLRRNIAKKGMQVPGLYTSDTAIAATASKTITINNVVVGVPAYFGQGQRKAVEEAARLAGFSGHVSTLTESTAAAMAYGLFVAAPSTTEDKNKNKSILVLDMGGGTTDITIAEMDNSNNNDSQTNKKPKKEDGTSSNFQVMLTDGDNRLGGEDMDQALYQLTLEKAASANNGQVSLQQIKDALNAQQRQALLRSCQQAKEKLCGDVDHGDPPESSAVVRFPESMTALKIKKIEVTQDDLNKAIQSLLERTARLIERTLERYATKTAKDANTADMHEVILIGGATRVPALRDMLKSRFFSDIELCVSVNAMSAVAQGTAIQAAILSRQVPLHEVRSAMMLDTTPHAIGVLVSGGNSDGSNRFVEILPRDAPLPAQSFATFYVGDLDQKGITVAAVESVGDPQSESGDILYQPLGNFTFLLHRLSELQREAIREDTEHPGLRPVDIGMTLDTSGAFQVSVFDHNDPDHIRKKEFYQKRQGAPDDGNPLLDYVVKATTTDWKKDGMTAEEFKLVVTASLLFVFYIFVKVLISKDVSEEDMARIL